MPILKFELSFGCRTLKTDLKMLCYLAGGVKDKI